MIIKIFLLFMISDINLHFTGSDPFFLSTELREKNDEINII
jgi:hypothetical protein